MQQEVRAVKPDDFEVDAFVEKHFDVREDEPSGLWVIWSIHGNEVVRIPKANNVKVANVYGYGDPNTARRAAFRLARLLVEGWL